jgi:RimJ/RimL family protein N-acetyltransferase
VIETERLILRQWTDADRSPLAAILADPEVAHDWPAPLTPAQSSDRLARYAAHIARLGFGKFAVERRADGALLGYVGVAEIFPELPVYPGLEIGWRLAREAWGAGFAAEAARASLAHVFSRTEAREVIAFTAPTNDRSLAVMRRLGLRRDAARDFRYPQGGEASVFVADRAARG